MQQWKLNAADSADAGGCTPVGLPERMKDSIKLPGAIPQ
jgi:hypothetical protein